VEHRDGVKLTLIIQRGASLQYRGECRRLYVRIEVGLCGTKRIWGSLVLLTLHPVVGFLCRG
jgi:hypothetical protein